MPFALQGWQVTVHANGDLASHTEAELRFKSHVLSGDVNGDGSADFAIFVSASTLVEADFVL